MLSASSFLFAIGYIYDQFLALWKEQRTVDTERNPFGTYALIPANVVIVGMINRLLRDRADGDESVIETAVTGLTNGSHGAAHKKFGRAARNFGTLNFPPRYPTSSSSLTMPSKRHAVSKLTIEQPGTIRGFTYQPRLEIMVNLRFGVRFTRYVQSWDQADGNLE